jgi:isoprenylcysteine carboxyl methyltransferase (ICMT) family protein YpbQ
MYEIIVDKSPLILLVFVLIRLASVIISLTNEKKLKSLGAVEYGKQNSLFLMLGHFIFYGACFTEGSYSTGKDGLSTLGLGLYIFAIIMLYCVIIEIRHIWTVKLIIAPRNYHVINKSVLFRYIKHPNYYLNIIPELFGLALIFHAWYTLLIGFPIYFILLLTRIRLEESIMKKIFVNY